MSIDVRPTLDIVPFGVSGADCGTSASFALQGGVYIIEAQTAEAKKAMKVVVK